METFGLIMCFVIFAGLQHLANWLFRISFKEKDEAGHFAVLGLMSIGISIIVAYSIIRYLQC